MSESGRVQILNGRLYYSPNCSRSVGEPLIEAAEKNPFLPPPQNFKRPGLRNAMDLDIRDYRHPRWWTRPWGWISFFPHEPDFLQPPFHPLSDIPHRLHRLPDGSGYEMSLSLAESWEKLDRDISFVTYLLQVHYNVAALRPMNPRGFGYNKSRPRPRAVMRSIYKSRDWFSVWAALLSYLIACAESTEQDLKPYPFLAKKNWATHLMEKGVDRTLLDALISSFVFRFTPTIVRSGVFLHIPPKDVYQPSVDWFCRYDVPVWYPWGEEQARNPRFLPLAPETHLLQLGTTTISKSPSRNDTPDAELVILVEETRPTISEVPKSSYKEQFLASWSQFHVPRKALNQRMEQAETTLERQKRLAREHRPPTTSAKVFRWIKDIRHDRYIRKQVHKKWRLDTLTNYSAKQVQYDSFSNEWDCSSEFGSDNEYDSVAADSDNEEDLFVDYDLANEACSAAPLPSTELKPSVDFGDEERWLPFSSQTQPLQSPDSISLSLDMYEEEIIETAAIHFGYIPPLPAQPRPALSETSCQKNFLRILGLSWNADSPSLFNRPRILALIDFMEKLSSQGAISLSTDEWDLSRENRACIAFAVRFRLLEEVRGPNGPLFMLDLHEHATVKWTLTLTTAAHALLVCRLHPQFQESDIAVYLLRRGIPFHTLQDVETLQRKPLADASAAHLEHPFRPHKYVFDICDYEAYKDQCHYILNRSCGRAALLRGGYLWRVAVSEVSFDKVLAGPSGLSLDPDETVVVTLSNGKKYADDSLKESEMLALTGVYSCATAHVNQIALKSWCPSPSLYTKSGLDYGRWTSYNESLYALASTNVKAPDAKVERQPCPANQWRNICRGSRALSRAMFKLEEASLSLIRHR